MNSAEPLNESQIAHAVEMMLAKHGNDALVKARERAGDYRTQGAEALARSWELIHALIKERKRFDEIVSGYEDAFKKGVVLSE